MLDAKYIIMRAIYKFVFVVGGFAFCLLHYRTDVPSDATQDAIEVQRIKNISDRVSLERKIFGANHTYASTYDDPVLTSFILLYHLFPPSPRVFVPMKPILALPDEVKDVLWKAVRGERNKGFFVECGANDGEFMSNTLELEIRFSWRGLLIEASPTIFPKLQTKARNNSWLSNVCLSPRPEQLEMYKWKNMTKDSWQQGVGRLQFESKSSVNEHYTKDGKVDCVPLGSVLKTMDITDVDFLSLDVEGNEYKVLANFPYHDIAIKVALVEYVNVPEGKHRLKALMVGHGYKFKDMQDDNFLFWKF